MACINTNREFTTENLLDAICNYLGVDVYDNELFTSGAWGNGNPIKVAKTIVMLEQINPVDEKT